MFQPRWCRISQPSTVGTYKWKIKQTYHTPIRIGGLWWSTFFELPLWIGMTIAHTAWFDRDMYINPWAWRVVTHLFSGWFRCESKWKTMGHYAALAINDYDHRQVAVLFTSKQGMIFFSKGTRFISWAVPTNLYIWYVNIIHKYAKF
jgi:hypothetical protein